MRFNLGPEYATKEIQARPKGNPLERLQGGRYRIAQWSESDGYGDIGGRDFWAEVLYSLLRNTQRWDTVETDVGPVRNGLGKRKIKYCNYLPRVVKIIMSENLFNSSHKATNDKYREGYDSVFGKKDKQDYSDQKVQFGTVVDTSVGKEVFNGPIAGLGGWWDKCQD